MHIVLEWGGLRKLNFLVYPCVFLLTIIILLRKERLLKWTDNRAVKKLGSVTYATYLSHMMIINSIESHDSFLVSHHRYFIYLLVCMMSFVLGYLFTFLERVILKCGKTSDR